MSPMSRDLAIDLGTANTLVYAKGEGIVLNEPTVIALNTRTHEVLAIGNEAWQMIGRTPGYIVAVRPLREGAITDFDITERMIRLLLQRVGVTRLNRPRVLICVPSAITSVERRAVKEAARRAGASAAYLIEQPMAAAIGAGLAIHEPVGNMVVDVGGGTTETAVISLGRRGGAAGHPVRRLRHRRRHPGLRAPRARDRHRRAHGRGAQDGHRLGPPLRGRARGRDPGPRGHDRAAQDGASSRPRRCATPVEDQVARSSRPRVECLGDAPPELAQDIIFQGIHLVGGGALLRGIGQRLADETAVPVHLVDTPLECVVLGAGRCLDSFDTPARLFADAELRSRRSVASSRSSAT